MSTLPSHRTHDTGTACVGRSRVLQVAFACDPESSMEKRIGWQRALIASRVHDVVVLCGPDSRLSVLEDEAKKLGVFKHIKFIQVSGSSISRSLCRTATTYYVGYRLWHRAAYQVAKQLHEEQPFDLVHQTTFCGFREPGECWKIDAPFIWGPVGGTQSFPFRYLSQLCPQTAWIELCRNAINFWQLRFSFRVRAAARKSSVVISATKRAQTDLREAQKLESSVQLETALDFPASQKRPLRDSNEPIKLLWSGRLKAWKTLPLLLKALSQLPSSVHYKVRILGEGDCEKRWKKLAKKLGVSDQIEWLGWPSYRETLPHYQWADAFVFTSMRDTSGTGLQEALAMGAPILGVNHQGAADIMTDRCAIPLTVSSPKETVRSLATSIEMLASDPKKLKSLSDGAIDAAKCMTWEQQIEPTLSWYRAALFTKELSNENNLALNSSNVLLEQEAGIDHQSSKLFKPTIESKSGSLKSI